MATVDSSEARTLFEAIVGRAPSDGDLAALMDYAEAANLTRNQVVATLAGRGEVMAAALADAPALHLFAIHRARVGLMASVLPRARTILDLGGANAPLHECGYPYSFDQMTLVDLPPAERHLEFANRIVESSTSEQGPVRVLYTDMTDLSAIDDGTIDLVWSGQSIEHVTRDDAIRTYREVRRVLSADGSFCLDTPNALVTRLHSPAALIHPDHKIEYTPDQLRADLIEQGFEVVQSLGVIAMPLTVARGSIDYRDFLIGAGLTDDLSRAYIQYHHCKKADPAAPDAVLPSSPPDAGVGALLSRILRRL